MKKISNLPIGSLVKDPETTYYGKPIIWKIADKNHSGYPTNSVTLITDKIISIKPYDGIERNNSDSDRRENGRNYYKKSNLLQWLNSGETSWYKPMDNIDAPPSRDNVWASYNPYDKEPGFLTSFSASFLNSIKPTIQKTVRHDLDGGGSENVTSKIFLASTTEVGLENERWTAEGNKFPIFIDNNSRKSYVTQEAINASNYKVNLNASSSWWWWLRTPDTSNSFKLKNVNMDGMIHTNNAFGGNYGVRPLCNISADTYVEDNKGSDGAYTIVLNRPPSIDSYTSSNMGQKDEEFSISYWVADDDYGQSLTVEEYVDNSRTKQFSANSGSTYKFTLTSSAFKKLLNGNHSIKIVARDNQGGVAKKVFNFSKNETKILFTLEQPLEADAMVTRATINLVGSIPKNALLKVEACNNGNDSNPTWEDCTDKVLKERKIFLLNKKKTASKWGFNVRVSVDRNGTEGDCYISLVRGNFE